MSEYTPTTDAVRKAYAQRYVEQVEYTTVGYSEFDRWLAAHDAEVRAGVVAEEPEWEYMNRFGSLVTYEEHATVKRRKAGPWEPVES